MTENALIGKSVLVTGATGLISHSLVPELLHKGAKVIAITRDMVRAGEIFAGLDNISFVENDLSTVQPIAIDCAIDYIVHGGCPTSSVMMAEQPVEVIDTIINGTRKVLELAKQKQVKAMVFLSSMEVYGVITNDSVAVTEDMCGNINLLNQRSSYPMGKRMAETLCCAYYKEYGVPVSIARLTQTIGPGVDIQTDNRVFAQFARSAMNQEDIVLHTAGNTKRMYLHAQDAAGAIICLLHHGEPGEAYNVANEDTYVSIKEMADLVCEQFSPASHVVVKEQTQNSYLPEIHLRLSTAKLRQLGWKPRLGLLDMYKSILESLA